MKLYVGNIPYALDDASLGAVPAPFGTVESAKVAIDRVSGKSKGFGFVYMPDKKECEADIKALNHTKLLRGTIRVKLAAEKPEPDVKKEPPPNPS